MGGNSAFEIGNGGTSTTISITVSNTNGTITCKTTQGTVNAYMLQLGG